MRKILLIDKRPDLAEQVVDKSLLQTLGVSSKDKIRWRCEKGHEWDASVANRAMAGRGCPYCSGRYAIPGETDLGTVRPDIAAQLVDKSLASQLKPTSHTKVEWRCEKGHVWSAAVSTRVANGSGCPYCSGRKAWVGETDLATTHPELAAELVDQSLVGELTRGSNKVVAWRCSVCGHVWNASVNSRVHMGSGCPHCTGRVLVQGENDIMSCYPEIAAEMVDQELAKRTFRYSNKVVKWRCKHGHEWEASVSSRTMFGTGCPYCSGRRTIVGENDLAVVRPDLVAEMVDSDEAVGLHVTSHRKVRWKCSNGHMWDAIVSNRVQFGYGCPICAAARGSSDVEASFADMVGSLVGTDEVVRNDRRVLGGKELDVLVPDRNVAFEFNGVWWHSIEHNAAGALRHVDKMAQCASRGVSLYVVWEDEWRARPQAVESYARFALGCPEPSVGNVYVREVTEADAAAFCAYGSLDHGIDYERYVAVFDDAGIAALIGGSDAGKDALSVRLLGMVRDVSAHVTDALAELAHLAGRTGGVTFQMWSERGYECDALYRSFGFSVVGYGDVKRHRVHCVEPYLRVGDALADKYADASSWCEVYDSGSVRWSMTVSA